MLTYHLIQTSSILKRDLRLWEELILKELGEVIHPDRKLGFILSRMALQNCFRDLGIPLQINQLLLDNFHQLKDHPDYTLSLSHTKNFGAAVLGPKKNYLSLGIDIEDQRREIKENIFERISHPLDQNLRKIELWCLKEAAFKAIMNQKSLLPIEFSSIEIRKSSFFHSPSNTQGEWKLEVRDELILAQAILKN